MLSRSLYRASCEDLTCASRAEADGIGERGAFKLHAVIGRGGKKNPTRFRRSEITCGEGRSRVRETTRESGGEKPEAQLRPSFSAVLPIYILRRIYRSMCMFLISWMRARIYLCISRLPNVHRSTDSSFSHFFSHFFSRLPTAVFPSFSLTAASFHFYTESTIFYPLSFFAISFFSIAVFVAHPRHFRVFSASFLLSSLAHFVIL